MWTTPRPSASDRVAGDASALVRDAELALLEHKRRPLAAWRTFSPVLRERARERLALIEALPGAGARGELELRYQPVVRLDDQAIVGLEALVRWRREGQLVPPAAFIPLAEETGAIVELGDAVLRLALGELAAARDRFPDARVHVNVSARELDEADYPDRLAALLRETGVAPETLVLEVTESLTVGANAERLLHALRGLGVGLAIDDFGAGYSNFATLERLPVDHVKVDRALLGGASGAPRAGFLRAAVEVIRSVGLVAVCEGVETEAQRALVRAAGFDAAQGYLYGQPAPLADLARAAA
jgi:EAL domain-containing protein (putative c-di-GMP-specific phosphodiesterase class I)